MRLPVDIQKCVVFIGLQMADESYKIVGTALLIIDNISTTFYSYIVTAKHVIEGIHSKGLDHIFIRANHKDGTSEWYRTKHAEWRLNPDPNIDVAIFPTVKLEAWDHLSYQLKDSLTPQVIKSYQIGIGEEVFVIGLFSHHHGQKRNIPIARIGNIAAMNEEKIQTSLHLMDGYLIEARSIGGLSGSPVFVNLGEIRVVDGEMKFSINGALALMGIIYGHYDVNTTNIDEVETDVRVDHRTERVNTGIAIVTPVDNIIDTIRLLSV